VDIVVVVLLLLLLLWQHVLRACVRVVCVVCVCVCMCVCVWVAQPSLGDVCVPWSDVCVP
jgi:Mn2+/Fe2+ NRAMP family transporter